MKFLIGFITSLLLCMLLFIGAWFYFDLPIDTNDETQTTNETSYNTSYSPTDDTTNETTDDTTNETTDETSKEQSEATDYQSTNQPTQQELDDTADNWMLTYKTINEGTAENPYVTINGKKVDPKFVINENGSLSQEYLQREEVYK